MTDNQKFQAAFLRDLKRVQNKRHIRLEARVDRLQEKVRKMRIQQDTHELQLAWVYNWAEAIAQKSKTPFVPPPPPK